MKYYVIYLRHWMGTTYKEILVAMRNNRADAEKVLAEYRAQGGDYFIKEEIPSRKCRPRFPKKKKV